MCYNALVRVSKFVVLLLTAACAYLAAPASALAANSTCTTHDLALTDWSVQLNHINTSWDFKCGGANNEDYHLILYLQKKLSDGTWATSTCTALTHPYCVADRPDPGSSYNGGTEHSGTNSWNPLPDIACHQWRLHADVLFAGSSPDIAYNSLAYSIGGC